MRRAGLDVSLDTQTTKLIKLAQALRLSEALPPASGRRLEQMARSVRLFAEATEENAAAAVLDQMTAMLADADEPGMDEVRTVLERAADRVLALLARVGVERALQDAQFRDVPGRAA
jgi:pyridoxine/pyridoxamine 5'-phosphate oxidase